ncbi:MAG: DUF2924 domain-containing protein [Aestuariivirga sp.]
MTQVIQRLLALKSASTSDLRAQWRSLFGKEAPLYNRKFMESRLAYRIQELAYGGLKPQTQKRLAALAEDHSETSPVQRRQGRENNKPINGTKLVREYRGQDYLVTVTAEGFTFDGRPYKSLSAIARVITGTRWNGWTFFGLKSPKGES